MMPYGWHDGGWGVLWMILWWAVIVGVVYLVVRGVSQGSRERPRDARDVLEERFARGEISEEEFKERRRVLDESRR